MNPYAKEYHWSGTVTLDLGDCGEFDADLSISYTYDGNSWSRGDHHLTTYMMTTSGESVEINLTDCITESALDEIFNEYIVSQC